MQRPVGIRQGKPQVPPLHQPPHLLVTRSPLGSNDTTRAVFASATEPGQRYDGCPVKVGEPKACYAPAAGAAFVCDVNPATRDAVKTTMRAKAVPPVRIAPIRAIALHQAVDATPRWTSPNVAS